MQKFGFFAGLGGFFGQFFSLFFGIFSCKTSAFWGAGCSFGYIFLALFCHFFMQKFNFLRGWVVFLSKKRQFFSCKTSVFAGLGGLFGTFFVIFLSFCSNHYTRGVGGR